MKKHPKNVQRLVLNRLAVRLSVVATLVCVAMGMVAYFVETHDVDGMARAIAEMEVSSDIGPVSGLLENPQERDIPTLTRAAEKLLAQSFLTAEIYDVNKHPLVRVNRASSASLIERIARMRHEFPAAEHDTLRRVYIDETLYMVVMVPIETPNKKVVGYFEGVFALNAPTMRHLSVGVLTTVVVSILGTALIAGSVYPIVLRLNRNLIKRTASLEKANKELKLASAANRAKTDFLSGMSHELRTPMNAIIGFSDMMVHNVFGPIDNLRYEEYARDINASGHHLLDLINDILDLSKIEAGKFELHVQDVETVSLVESCLNLVSGRATAAHVQLTAELDHGPALVQGDVRKLKQVLINLLTNAIKFTPIGGRVTLRVLSTVTGGVRLEVCDTGMGISEQDMSKIMQPFWQAKNARVRDQEGTGLGLILSKSLMELHGGTLSITSTLGQGTTVIATLPPAMASGGLSDGAQSSSLKPAA